MKKNSYWGFYLGGRYNDGWAAVLVFAADGDRVKITYAQWEWNRDSSYEQAVADKSKYEQDKIEAEVVKIDHDTYVIEMPWLQLVSSIPALWGGREKEFAE